MSIEAKLKPGFNCFMSLSLKLHRFCKKRKQVQDRMQLRVSRHSPARLTACPRTIIFRNARRPVRPVQLPGSARILA